MDALPTFTTSVVHYSPQLDNTAKNVSDDDVLYVTTYDCTRTCSSGLYGYVSDHPSQDLSDLALGVRDDTFAAPPGIVIRTYSSSDESIHLMESSEDEILEASQYCGIASYSSDEYVYASDHQSEDLSDLGQAVRDESFTPAPRGISRTYSSSDESSEWSGEVDHGDRIIEGVSRSHETVSDANNIIQRPATCDERDCDDEWEQDEDVDGYASVEDNADSCDEIAECKRTFQVTDRVPTSTAQWLFVAAWNGNTSSCGEDAGDIDTLPSEGEQDDMENMANEGGYGSIHTLESSEGLVENENWNGEILDQGSGKVSMSVAPTSTALDVITSTETHEIKLGAERPGIAAEEIGVTRKGCLIESGDGDESGETDSEDVSHIQRISDIKVSTRKKRNGLKRFMKVFSRCFGGN